ncbi:uncharacterized protein BDR25DRAFT_358025 [Lindgomyces ingoldianus]|uniref:Uncharacterized protein n=1 Tax=Lindgomyces ingoldianus TaxID=673940 RepID=A0ACB6QQD3_9PLEO|nr:uncharacterized protein BDR25DRAFT_358025 [Lindgomyces ingoldianus]KAF2468292.1 hypothetical protein BDR25DRAFT_358025 [Lindgomyces ingoldianus]
MGVAGGLGVLLAPSLYSGVWRRLVVGSYVGSYRACGSLRVVAVVVGLLDEVRQSNCRLVSLLQLPGLTRALRQMAIVNKLRLGLVVLADLSKPGYCVAVLQPNEMILVARGAEALARTLALSELIALRQSHPLYPDWLHGQLDRHTGLPEMNDGFGYDPQTYDNASYNGGLSEVKGAICTLSSTIPPNLPGDIAVGVELCCLLSRHSTSPPPPPGLLPVQGYLPYWRRNLMEEVLIGSMLGLMGATIHCNVSSPLGVSNRWLHGPLSIPGKIANHRRTAWSSKQRSGFSLQQEAEAGKIVGEIQSGLEHSSSLPRVRRGQILLYLSSSLETALKASIVACHLCLLVYLNIRQDMLNIHLQADSSFSIG